MKSLVTPMTSDEKTLAFLARRVGALEKKVKELNKDLEATRNDILGNQQVFLPVVKLLAEVLPLVKNEVEVSALERQRIYDAITTQSVQMTKCLPPCFKEGHGI